MCLAIARNVASCSCHQSSTSTPNSTGLLSYWSSSLHRHITVMSARNFLNADWLSRSSHGQWPCQPACQQELSIKATSFESLLSSASLRVCVQSCYWRQWVDMAGAALQHSTTGITRSTGTLHTSTKARLTSVAKRIHIRICDPDRHQTLIICSLAHFQPSLKISCKSIWKFLCKVDNGQRDK